MRDQWLQRVKRDEDRIRRKMVEWEWIAAAANVAQNDPEWSVSPAAGSVLGQCTVRSRRDRRPVARTEDVTDDANDPILEGRAVAEHIALHDPATELRGIAADRELINAMTDEHRIDAAGLWDSVLDAMAKRYGVELEPGA